MKLAVKINEVRSLRQILGFVLSIRKHCVLKFSSAEGLEIISIDREGPIVWGKLSKINFIRYDVIAKDDLIVLELNAEPIYQIVKNYEKSPVVSDLAIRLQRGDTNNDNGNKRKPVFLGLSYNEDLTMTQEIFHSFSIPVSLIRGRNAGKFLPPDIAGVELSVDMNQTLVPFFMRVERYKAVDNINVVLNKLGELKIEFQDEAKKISLKWKSLLEVWIPEDLDTQNKVIDLDSAFSEDTNSNVAEKAATDHALNQRINPTHTGYNNDRERDLDMIKEITVRVKLKWWNLASKLLSQSENLNMHIHAAGCLFNCSLEDEHSNNILYYLPGKLLD